jgi:hypothetical protein
MAKHYVVFIRDHTVIHPATVLESSILRTGEMFHVADIPESRSEYKEGQKVTFSRKKDALAFVQAMKGAAKLD